jgi:hypothetical protein
VSFDKEQLPIHIATIRILHKICEQLLSNWNNCIRTIPNLNRYDSVMARRWIGRDIREIAVELDKQGIKFFGVAQDNRIGRIRLHAIMEPDNFMSGVGKQNSHAVRYAVVEKESHVGATSNSANSRA